MRKLLLALFALCLISSTAFAGTAAENGGFYIGIEGGQNFERSEYSSTSVSRTSASKLKTTRPSFGFLGGYDFGQFRVAGTVSSQNYSVSGTTTTTNEIQNYSPTTRALSGDVSVTSIMTNLYYDLPRYGVNPYVTVGAGATIVNCNNVTDGATSINNQKTNFACKVGAGCSYNITRNMFVDLEYQYDFAGAIKLDNNSSSDNSSSATSLGEVRVPKHAIKLGLGYNFR
jgi:opacity protein-like surface antigen